MTHPFFDDLKVPDTKMATGKDMPPLFNFTREGGSSRPFSSYLPHLADMLHSPLAAELSIRPDLIRQLVPPHCEAELQSRGIDINNFEPIPLADMRITLDVSFEISPLCYSISPLCRPEKRS